jgi:hypothetical protein
MPEPKKTQRSYDALTDSALDGLQLVQQRGQKAEDGQPPAAPKARKARRTTETHAPELVSRLIDCIKKI